MAAGPVRASGRTVTDAAASGFAVRLEAATAVYGTGAAAVTALHGVTAGIPRGTFTGVMGPSGSGKSTFLHLAAGLDRPASGRVLLGDTDLSGLSETALTELRRERIGFVFQAYNLIPALSVRDNITLPLRFARRPVDPAWLARIVNEVGIDGLLARRPGQLSGGQQQRVAIARALVTRPDVVFADEPTGALDTGTGAQVLGLLRGLVDSLGQTVVMVTHDPVAASYAHFVMFLADGRFVDQLYEPTAESVAARMTGLGER
ncbi:MULTISPECIES: ABC transporter ATP-binding protein [unclassified Streptomyces]|uniref:ABC transporter ATP-binding protein n=1 Tax=unclassified Streptomyces TaxID=2593676 RepID=UPI002E2B6639|nr:ABC transporter ATP-binding protein [Streptomyces sp. NBC_01429]